MDNNSYTKLNIDKLQDSSNDEHNSPDHQSLLKRNPFYLLLTGLIGITLMVSFFLFAKKAPTPSETKVDTQKLTINPTKLQEQNKSILNSSDISDKNIFDKSTFDKRKKISLPPPQDPYATKRAEKPTSTPKSTSTVANPIVIKKPSATPTKTTPTATNTPNPTKTPTPTSKPSATPTVVKPTAIVTQKSTPTLKPTATAMPSPKATVTPQPKQQQTGSDTYIVKSGDSLWNISMSVYGSGEKAYEIAKENNISNPSQIFAGQKLVLHKTQSQQNIAQKSTNDSNGQIMASNTKASDKEQKYTVQKGDNLWNISVQFYGTGYNWTKISNANHLANPRVIHSGNILIIPSKSTV